MVRLNVFVSAAAGDSLSVTVTPKVYVPPSVGVPDKSPAELNVSPAGSVDPVASDH
jgi:hypothetical protein